MFLEFNFHSFSIVPAFIFTGKSNFNKLKTGLSGFQVYKALQKLATAFSAKIPYK
jgi:hypothetical protein